MIKLTKLSWVLKLRQKNHQNLKPAKKKNATLIQHSHSLLNPNICSMDKSLRQGVQVIKIDILICINTNKIHTRIAHKNIYLNRTHLFQTCCTFKKLLPRLSFQVDLYIPIAFCARHCHSTSVEYNVQESSTLSSSLNIYVLTSKKLPRVNLKTSFKYPGRLLDTLPDLLFPTKMTVQQFSKRLQKLYEQVRLYIPHLNAQQFYKSILKTYIKNPGNQLPRSFQQFLANVLNVQLQQNL
eukprot:TRINITY_DN19149_c0_g1_i1.p6 TRINITY_DN19149_c0_g1~~TRINITY_DN19149_c0_g1_i1.p6  ORF type:complete len:239 (+),score=-9.87 TRINITY_DN19149_c0_g1_i1:1399-2115(+)